MNRSYKIFVGTLHFALENGADLYVNERLKIRHYRARSTEERRSRIRRIRRKKKKNGKSQFFTLRGAYVNWCLKCVKVYLARVIPAFVMYCVNGASCSSLLIESTDSKFLVSF